MKGDYRSAFSTEIDYETLIVFRKEFPARIDIKLGSGKVWIGRKPAAEPSGRAVKICRKIVRRRIVFIVIDAVIGQIEMHFPC